MGGVHGQAGPEHDPAVLRGRRALTATVVVLVLATLTGLPTALAALRCSSSRAASDPARSS